MRYAAFIALPGLERYKKEDGGKCGEKCGCRCIHVAICWIIAICPTTKHQ